MTTHNFCSSPTFIAGDFLNSPLDLNEVERLALKINGITQNSFHLDKFVFVAGDEIEGFGRSHDEWRCKDFPYAGKVIIDEWAYES